MKRVVAVLLVVVMVAGICTSVADEENAKVFDELEGVAKTLLQQAKIEYEKNGMLTDGQIEMAYSYLKMMFAARMTSTVERYFPASGFISLGNDADTTMGSIIDSAWLEVVKGEGDKEDFVKKLMAVIEVYAN